VAFSLPVQEIRVPRRRSSFQRIAISTRRDKRDELLLLINSRYPIIAVETSEETATNHSRFTTSRFTFHGLFH